MRLILVVASIVFALGCGACVEQYVDRSTYRVDFSMEHDGVRIDITKVISTPAYDVRRSARGGFSTARSESGLRIEGEISVVGRSNIYVPELIYPDGMPALPGGIELLTASGKVRNLQAIVQVSSSKLFFLDKERSGTELAAGKPVAFLMMVFGSSLRGDEIAMNLEFHVGGVNSLDLPNIVRFADVPLLDSRTEKYYPLGTPIRPNSP